MYSNRVWHLPNYSYHVVGLYATTVLGPSWIITWSGCNRRTKTYKYTWGLGRLISLSVRLGALFGLFIRDIDVYIIEISIAVITEFMASPKHR